MNGANKFVFPFPLVTQSYPSTSTGSTSVTCLLRMQLSLGLLHTMMQCRRTRGYCQIIQEVRRGYKRLKEVTRGYKRLMSGSAWSAEAKPGAIVATGLLS